MSYKVLKIKSITDVITNSSSEVFVAYDDDGELITWDWLKENEEFDMLMCITGISKDNLVARQYLEHRYKPDSKDYWLKILQEFREQIEEKIIKEKLYWHDVEDFYDDDWNYYSGSDYLNYIWTDYRH